ncbi:MAG TPA: ABC transporter ATP-binding protein [Vicinamibacterales bacterium]|nr:ABC transporter ATP-binding protein [Vicinamibacterales bacterium]
MNLHHFSEFALVVRRLRPYLEAERSRLAAVLASSLFVMVFEGAGVGLLVPLLSLLLGGENATPMRPLQWLADELPGHSAAFYVAIICAAIVVAIAAKNVAAYVSQVLAADLKKRISITLRDALFRRLHTADLDVFDRSPGGEIANVFLVETYRVTLAIDVLVATLQRSAIGLFYLGALCYISWQLTLLVMALAGAIGSVLAFVYRRITMAGVELTDLNHRIASLLTQSFAGVRIVRATNSQAQVITAFQALSTAQARAEERSTHASSLLFPLTETLAVVGAMLIVCCAYIFFVRTGHMLSSYLLAYGFMLLRLLPLLNQLYGLQGHLLYLAGGVREVQVWLDTPVYPERPFGTRVYTPVRDAVRFERVSYTYPNGATALQDVEFSVAAGQTVAIVGASGSGKSTLAALLLRFRAPTRGSITVDGVDYWEYSPDSWHRATALVEQDAFLFHGTLRENIVYGFDRATPAALQRAIDVANLSDVVAQLPQGLDTLVGERGAMVSGGQRQRIAIARAVIRDPSILILDEATSHLDSVSEQLVQQALLNASRGRTTIVIAHRLSTIREADKLIVLEHGRLVEEGSWEALEAAGGAFQRLLRAV